VKVDLRVASGELALWKAFAEERGQSLSSLIRVAVRGYVEEMPAREERMRKVLGREPKDVPVGARVEPLVTRPFRPDFKGER
jgi:hypothetical protein